MLVPQIVAGLAGFVPPPRIASPPPPLPVSGVAVQPEPILDVLLIDLFVMSSQMGVNIDF